MDNPTARNKEVRDRAKKLEAQIMGHMFDMCWPEFIAYCHEVAGALIASTLVTPRLRSKRALLNPSDE
jgi:hypothetical protein